MLCPRCGSNTEVNRTNDLDFKIERNRRCLACGKYFNTVEVPMYDYEILCSGLPNHQKSLFDF